MTDLLRLIISSYSFSDDQAILKVAHSLKADLQADAYTCIVVHCDGVINDPIAYHRLFFALPQQCESFFLKQNIRALATCTEAGECVVVLLGNLSSSKLEKHLNTLLSNLQKHHYENVYISASDAVQNISALRDSYTSAKNALLYHNPSENRPIHYSRNIRMIYNSSSLQNGIEFERILKCFRMGDLEQVLQLSTLYAEKIRAISPKQEGDPYPTSIKRMFIELTVYVLHIASDAGVNVDEQLGHIDPYTHLMSLVATPQIIEWFMGVCSKMRDGINKKAQRKESSLVLRACEYIQHHLGDYDLSLETVSNHVNITPAYFSSLFHKEKGVAFSVYIRKARIDMAAELLQSSDLSVTEIAHQAGFSTVNYFTRTFKKTLGMPPGQYRSEKKK